MNDAALRFLADRSVDSDVIAQASQEKRVLLTEDKDFGQLVFASQADSAGVILIRYPGNTRKSLPKAVVRLVHEQGNDIRNAFVVIQPGHIRMSRIK